MQRSRSIIKCAGTFVFSLHFYYNHSMTQEIHLEPQNQIGTEQNARFMRELEEKGGFNNFRADFEGGYARIGFQDDIEAQQRKDPNKRLGKSMREYWDDIDTALEEEGIGKEGIKNIQDGIRSESENLKKLAEKLNPLLLPVYLRLRSIGYSHEDLTY